MDLIKIMNDLAAFLHLFKSFILTKARYDFPKHQYCPSFLPLYFFYLAAQYLRTNPGMRIFQTSCAGAKITIANRVSISISSMNDLHLNFAD